MEATLNNIIKPYLGKRLPPPLNGVFSFKIMILNFGKYKGYSLEDVFKKEPTYIEWLAKNTDKVIIKNECFFLLNHKGSKSKIEKIIFESLLSRGYSETESNMFINKLKK